MLGFLNSLAGTSKVTDTDVVPVALGPGSPARAGCARWGGRTERRCAASQLILHLARHQRIELLPAAEMNRFVTWVKSSATVTPNGEILMPGEIEERTKAQRLRDGIDLDATTWTQILDTAKAAGVGQEQVQASL